MDPSIPVTLEIESCQPEHDLIIVQRVAEQTVSGIIIATGDADEGSSVHPLFRVVAVGPGRYSQVNHELIPMPHVRPGDLIMCSPDAVVVPLLASNTLYEIVKASAILLSVRGKPQVDTTTKNYYPQPSVN